MVRLYKKTYQRALEIVRSLDQLHEHHDEFEKKDKGTRNVLNYYL